MLAGEVAEPLAEQLRGALSEAATGALALAFLVPLRHQPVRAAEPAPATAAQLELPEEAEELLGTAVETQVVTGASQLRVWVAGATQIEPGSRIGLVAITPEGDVAETTAVVQDSESAIELSLSWEFPQAPDAVALGIEQLVEE